MNTWSEVKWEKIHLYVTNNRNNGSCENRERNYVNRGVIVWTNPQGSVGATTLAAAAHEGRVG